MTKKRQILALALAVASVAATRAQFAPLTLTPESYNHDIIVELTATPPPALATTATMDQGTNNAAATFYEQGFNLDAPETGLPPAGTTFTAETLADHSYTLAPSYTAPNALLVNAQVTNSTYTLTTPTALSGLSFLASAGGFTSNGRVNAITRTFDTVNGNNPRLYSIDIALSNTTSPVTKVELQRNTGNGHAFIFAVSGSTGADFTPLAGTGYTYDVVVEATADQAHSGLNATTATVDLGIENTEYTWYEQGYNTAAPLTGLPAAGTTLTNAATADHIYRFAPDYAASNSILIDSGNPAVTIAPQTPTTASGLSFLGSSGGGAMTINFTIHHADSSTQEGSFVLPDWFNATPVAYTVNGRVNAVTANFQAVNSNNPRIYGVDVAVNNTASPITSIDLAYTTGGGHAAILAVSAAAGAIKPIFDGQPVSVNVLEGGATQLDAFVSGTAPITLRWQFGSNDTFVDLANSGGFSGVNTTNLVLTGATVANAADYRLIAVNSAGSTTGQVARVNVVSTKTDVTTPFDTVTRIGGGAPDNEPAANAINDDTAKYLNFGTDGDQNAPFAGPVGLEVTLAGGPAIVTGLRVYTANDATERDPIDFKLEGSNDGATFTTVASGALALPLTRNPGGANALPIDPLTLANQEVRFENAAGYSTYRLTFTNVRNNATANSVQIGEIELLGKRRAPVRLPWASLATPTER